MSGARRDSPKRRLPTTDQLRVWRSYIETTEILRSRLMGRLHDESGLSPGDYEVLLALSEAPGHRYRSSSLADHMGWQRSRLSHHLGRMEKRGLITREPCVTDNRGAEVVLAEAGAVAFDQATIPHLRAIRELFVDAFSAEQIEQIDEHMGALRAHLGLDGEAGGGQAAATRKSRSTAASARP